MAGFKKAKNPIVKTTKGCDKGCSGKDMKKGFPGFPKKKK